MLETIFIALGLVIAAGVVAIIVLLLRPRPPVADPEAQQRLLELNARLDAMGGWLQNSHNQLQQTVNTRLDAVSQNIGESMKTTTKNTTDHLQQLHARLAVIDSAQKNITDLATQVNSLQAVLANKQSRGAFGQANEDIGNILTSANRIEKRAGNIEELDFDGDAQPSAEIIAAPMTRKLGSGE